MLVGRWWWWWKSGARPLKVLELSAVAQLLPSISVACCQWSFLWSCHCPTFWLCAISKWLSFWAPDQSERPSYLWVAAHLSDFVPCWLAVALWPVSAVSQKWLESLVESMPIFDQVSRLQREKLLGSCCPAFVFEQSMHHTLLVAIPTTTKSGYIADMIFDKQLKRLAAKQVKHSTHATRRWRQYL